MIPQLVIREFQKDNFIISTDKLKVDMNVVHEYLSKDSYWAKNIPLEVVETAIKNSLTFSILDGEKLIGFARVITDYATYAYLCDVFVLPEYRKRNLSKWLLECILNYPELQGLRRWMLMTLDAQSLYEKYGFSPLKHPDRAMEISRPNIYTKH